MLKSSTKNTILILSILHLSVGLRLHGLRKVRGQVHLQYRQIPSGEERRIVCLLVIPGRHSDTADASGGVPKHVWELHHHSIQKPHAVLGEGRIEVG